MAETYLLSIAWSGTLADRGGTARAATERAGEAPVNPFTGPLFIVGMPRSGTKLLRDLLNRHPSIGIPVSESQFFPSLVRRFGEGPNFDDAAERRRFYDALRSTGFFAEMRARGLVFDQAQLEQVADRTSWCGILEAIFRHYGRTPAGGIWGDTTPQYLLHIELLKKLCPGARFIHIIQDPRDRCLSVRKESGTSILRTAERWRRNVTRAHQAGAALGDDYREVFYEALVSQPRETLDPLAGYLGLSFTKAMLRPGRVTEYSGDAKRRTDILIGNSGKYLSQLRPAEIRRIEEITFPLLGQLGYVPRHGSAFRPLGAAAMSGVTATDALTMLTTHVRRDGLFRGFRRWRGQACGVAERVSRRLSPRLRNPALESASSGSRERMARAAGRAAVQRLAPECSLKRWARARCRCRTARERRRGLLSSLHRAEHAIGAHAAAARESPWSCPPQGVIWMYPAGRLGAVAGKRPGAEAGRVRHGAARLGYGSRGNVGRRRRKQAATSKLR